MNPHSGSVSSPVGGMATAASKQRPQTGGSSKDSSSAGHSGMFNCNFQATACRIAKSGAWGLVALAALGAVFFTHSDTIPRSDRFIVSTLFLGVTVAGILFPSDEPPELPSHVSRRFLQLSVLELSATVLLPFFCVLLLDSRETESPLKTSSPSPSLASRIMCPHLFAFLAQIASEATVAMGGPTRRWLLFPVTLLWNAYRAFPLIRASHLIRTSHLLPYPMMGRATVINTPSPIDAVALSVHTASCFLWLYSTFYFCLFLWRPSYSLPRRNAKPEGKEN